MEEKSSRESANDTSPAADYRAAMHEVRSNVEVRRLMLVIVHILVPALSLAMADSLTGESYPQQIAWFPRIILPVVGGTLVVAGIVVTGILTRCHFGLVVNGTKMRRTLTGSLGLRGLNWLGVTTNFTALTALSAGAGLALLLVCVAPPASAIIAAPLLAVLLLVYLRVQHARANRLCTVLEPAWQHGEVPADLREEHTRLSLEAATSDIAIVATMGAALFAGTFGSLAQLGSIHQGLDLPLEVESIQRWGFVALSAYTLVALLLSARMIVRLRLALADLSTTLAELRDETDTPWRFRPFERTYLLFLFEQMLTTLSLVFLVGSLTEMRWAWTAGGILFLMGALWYPLRLRAAAPR